jgi:hypothetical protein
MKTINHPDTYQCEVCGAEYTTQFMTEMCEKRPAERKTDIKVGDKVLIETRYDGFFEDEVIDIFLDNNWYLSRYDSEAELNKVLPRFPDKTIRDNILEWDSKNPEPHEFLLKTSKSWNICNDGSCSDLWREIQVYPLKNMVWNESYNNLPELYEDEFCFIKWLENEETVIRRGDKSWFDKHWKSKVKFVAFSLITQ